MSATTNSKRYIQKCIEKKPTQESDMSENNLECRSISAENIIPEGTPPSLDPWKMLSDIKGKITKTFEEKLSEIKSDKKKPSHSQVENSSFCDLDDQGNISPSDDKTVGDKQMSEPTTSMIVRKSNSVRYAGFSSVKTGLKDKSLQDECVESGIEASEFSPQIDEDPVPCINSDATLRKSSDGGNVSSIKKKTPHICSTIFLTQKNLKANFLHLLKQLAYQLTYRSVAALVAICCIYYATPLPEYLIGLVTGIIATIMFYNTVARFKMILTNLPDQDLADRQIVPVLEIPAVEEHAVIERFQGWLNELPYHYEPTNYHVARTKSVFFRLEGTILRIMETRMKIPKKAVWDESQQKLKFVKKRVYNLSGAKIELLPCGLARKRRWSKKYPICITLKTKRAHVCKVALKESKNDACYSAINDYGQTISASKMKEAESTTGRTREQRPEDNNKKEKEIDEDETLLGEEEDTAELEDDIENFHSDFDSDEFGNECAECCKWLQRQEDLKKGDEIDEDEALLEEEEEEDIAELEDDIENFHSDFENDEFGNECVDCGKWLLESRNVEQLYKKDTKKNRKNRINDRWDREMENDDMAKENAYKCYKCNYIGKRRRKRRMISEETKCSRKSNLETEGRNNDKEGTESCQKLESDDGQGERSDDNNDNNSDSDIGDNNKSEDDENETLDDNKKTWEIEMANEKLEDREEKGERMEGSRDRAEQEKDEWETIGGGETSQSMRSKKDSRKRRRDSCRLRNQMKIFIFARADREKEDWYRRLVSASMRRIKRNDGSSCFTTDPSSTTNTVSSAQRTVITESKLSASTSHSFECVPELSYNAYMAKHLETNSSIIESEHFPYIDNTLWINCLVARILFDLHKCPETVTLIQDKIQRKLSSIKLPYFMKCLLVSEVAIGQGSPIIRNVTKPVTNERGLWLDFDITYKGSLTMTVETKLNLMKLKRTGTISGGSSVTAGGSGSDGNVAACSGKDNTAIKSPIFDSDVEDTPETSTEDDDSSQLCSPAAKETSPPVQSSGRKFLSIVDRIAANKYFQHATELSYVRRAMEGVSNTEIRLMVTVSSIEGCLSLNIPPAPSDRLWYGFKPVPKVTLNVKPAVGERAVNIAYVTKWIEDKLLREFEKVVVLPNMDDLVLPLCPNYPYTSAR
ncbi:uncharacterized protein LOC144468315 isoform X2 [Augochlora pura]